MSPHPKTLSRLAAALLLSVIAACGGGGSGDADNGSSPPTGGGPITDPTPGTPPDTTPPDTTPPGGGGEPEPPAPLPNQPPLAQAGDDRRVDENMLVLLDGAGEDRDGVIGAYRWTQTAGPAVTLSDAGSPKPSFVAPSVSGSAELRFTLQVSDDDGATASDEVAIAVADTTTVSVADAATLEGDSGRQSMNFSVTLSALQPQPVTLNYAVIADTAQEGVDFTAASGTLRFEPGEIEQRVSVQIAGDTIEEGEEGLQLQLSNIAGAKPGHIRASGTISDAVCAADNTDWESFPHLKGSLHEHSGYSDGEVGTSPADYYAAGAAQGLDFMGGADHSDTLLIPLTLSEDCLLALLSCINPLPSPDDLLAPLTKWSGIRALASAASTPAFTAFRGFEWTSDRFGHINVFLSSNRINAKLDGGYVLTMEPFWHWLSVSPAAGGGGDGLVVFNHPGREDTFHAIAPDAAYTYNDFEYRSEAARRVIGVETFGKSDHAYETDNNAPAGGWYAHALDKGWRLGPVGAEDEHGREWAQPNRAKTVLIARDRSIDALREAMLARRFYSIAQNHNDLRLNFTADGEPMGAHLARPAGSRVRIAGLLTAGSNDGGSLEIVSRSGETLAVSGGSRVEHEFTVEADERWFYLRVKDAAGRPVAYSAPVWIRERVYAACPAASNPFRSGLKTDQVVVAHRGASGHAPEHTFAAYDLALAQGAEYIEQDIAMTRDGVLVVLHDDSLDRTARGPAADCTGSVATKTLEQLKRCDMGSWFNERYPEQARPEYVGLQIPTLEEVFRRYGKRANYYIETKTLGSLQPMESALLELIDRYGLLEGAINRRQVLVQSFSPASLQRMQALEPRMPLVLLLSGGAGKARLQLAAQYAFGVGPPLAAVTGDMVKHAHALGLAVHPYTVNAEADLERLAALCVDGVFTNYPDRYREILNRRDYGCPLPTR